MTDVQHTPGVATVDPDYPDTIALGDRPETCDHYAKVVPSMDPDPEDLANAQRIALCWNCHDELLVALDVFIDCYDRARAFPSPNVVKSIRAKLAKAKGETE